MNRRFGIFRAPRWTPWGVLLAALAGGFLPRMSGAAQNAAALPAPIFLNLLDALKGQTHIPILLPAHLPPLANADVYAHAKGDSDSYSIRLESDPECDGANACFLGVFRAQRGGHISFPQPVKFGNGESGRYKATSCGGSCSSPAIEWKSNGTLYTVQLTLHTGDEKNARSLMVDLARQSILAGPR